MGTPVAGCIIMENPIYTGWFGGTHMSGKLHMYIIDHNRGIVGYTPTWNQREFVQKSSIFVNIARLGSTSSFMTINPFLICPIWESHGQTCLPCFVVSATWGYSSQGWKFNSSNYQPATMKAFSMGKWRVPSNVIFRPQRQGAYFGHAIFVQSFER